MKWIFFMTITKTFFITVAFVASALAEAPKMHKVEFSGFAKEYAVISTSAKAPVDIVYMNFRDDGDLITAAAKAMAEKIPQGTEVVIILGDKANILGALVAKEANLPWIILVTKQLPEGTFAKSTVFQSITTPGTDKTIYITKAQASAIKGKKVVILDDVVSTGATMKAGIEVITKADGKIQGIMCAFTEDKPVSELSGYPVISLGNVPVYPKA